MWEPDCLSILHSKSYFFLGYKVYYRIVSKVSYLVYNFLNLQAWYIKI